MSRIEERDPILAEEIRKLMFVFEDIAKIDDKGIQTLLKEVPNLLAINPAAFLDKPKYVRELIPYYFSFTTSPTSAAPTKQYDIAWEVEKYRAVMRPTGLTLIFC